MFHIKYIFPNLYTSNNVSTLSEAIINIFVCECIHQHLGRMCYTMGTRAVPITYWEMHQSLHQCIPQQLNGIQFWRACRKKLEKYPMIVPKEVLHSISL